MIQKWLKDRLKARLPEVKWTVDFESTGVHAGTVFYEGGGEPGRYDVATRFPRYMVWIESKDWEFAKYVADEVYDELNQIGGHTITVDFKKDDGTLLKTEVYFLQTLEAATDPNPLGVEEQRMAYSINFDAQLIELKEETQNAT